MARQRGWSSTVEHAADCSHCAALHASARRQATTALVVSAVALFLGAAAAAVGVAALERSVGGQAAALERSVGGQATTCFETVVGAAPAPPPVPPVERAGATLRASSARVVVVPAPPPDATDAAAPACRDEAQRQASEAKSVLIGNPSRSAALLAEALTCEEDPSRRALYGFALERQGRDCEARREYQRAITAGLSGRELARAQRSIDKFAAECGE